MGWPALVVPLLFLVACGEGERRTYTVRARYIMPVFDGEAMLVDHEAIPGYMDAMQMSFKVREPSEMASLQSGDKIRFTVVVTEYDAYAEAIALLPDDTVLDLAEPPGSDSLASDSLASEPPDSTRSGGG